MRIVFTGTHGTGKTTLLEEMRKDPHFSRFAFITNLTRDIMKRGFSINQDGDDRTQLALLSAHLNTLTKDNFILDRSLVDICAYNRYLNSLGKVSAEVVAFAESMLAENASKYDVIFYLKPEFAPVADGIRSTYISYRDAIAENIDDLLSRYSIPSVHLHGSVEERVAQLRAALY